MARTKKQTARKRSAGGQPNYVPPKPKERSVLLQRMGFPKTGEASSAQTATADWAAVVDRLKSHPEEAAIQDPYGTIVRETTQLVTTTEAYPMFLALQNEQTPLTLEALEALLEAHPDLVTNPRSRVMLDVQNNSVLREKHPEIIESLLKANPTYLCGPQRTRTFQLLGFAPTGISEDGSPKCIDYQIREGGGHQVDWEALEQHVREHPKEAKILCPAWEETCLFPLEAAIHFEYPPIPHSTFQLLLDLCPEAVTIKDSCVLATACMNHKLENPQIIRSILQTNPDLAQSQGVDCSRHTYEEQHGLPLHTAVCYLPCAAQIVQELIDAYPDSVGSGTNVYYQIPLQAATEKWTLSTETLRILLENGHRYYYKGREESGSRGQLFVRGYDDAQHSMENLIDTASMYREEWQRGVDLTKWQNLYLGWKAAGAFKCGLDVETMWEYPLLQAAIEFGARQYLVDTVLEQHIVRADLDRADGLGRTPLAVAIEMLSGNHEYDPEDICYSTILGKLLDDGNGYGSPHLARNPLPNGNGTSSLPLHRALHCGVGLEDGSQHIVSAYPEAVAIPDPQTKLLPCLLAAVGEKAKASTIFGLMIMRPNLIAALCQGNDA